MPDIPAIVPAPAPASGDSPALEVLFLITRANAAASATLDTALSRVGLWLNDLSLLTYLLDAGDSGMTRAQLAELLRQSQSETLRRLKPMEKLGWISRTSDGAFAVTLQGRERVSEATGLAANRSEAWLEERLDDRQLENLRELLAKLL